MQRKGFTLVELLIVIGILGVLAAAVVVVLNPAELLRQARDAQRISDLDSIRAALNLYLSDVASPDLLSTQAGTYAFSTLVKVCGGITGNCEATTTDVTVDGGGWVDVDLTGISTGSPLSTLPLDPVNASCTGGAVTTCQYVYVADDTSNTFELNTVLESTKFKTTEDMDGSDGGSSASHYEVGNDPGLDL